MSCNHAIRNLVEVVREPSPSPKDRYREWVVLVCKKCWIVKAGHESSWGGFRCLRAGPILPMQFKRMLAARGGQS